MREAAAGTDRKWTRAASEHRAALASFLEFAAGIPEPVWQRPIGEGKWTPAEVAEHLALSYEAVLRELDGCASPSAARAPSVWPHSIWSTISDRSRRR